MPRNSAILYIFHTIRFAQAPIFFKSPDLVPTYAIVIQSITHTTQERALQTWLPFYKNCSLDQYIISQFILYGSLFSKIFGSRAVKIRYSISLFTSHPQQLPWFNIRYVFFITHKPLKPFFHNKFSSISLSTCFIHYIYIFSFTRK